MLTTIGLIVLVALAGFLVVVATRPAAFRIQRRATIAAPADVVFAQLDDFRAWSRWSPFEKLDAELTRRYEGAPSGVGAVYHYVGKKAGEARMTVTESTPHERLAISARFIKPFAATNQVEFTLEPARDGVTVTWATSGHNSFVFKAFGLLVSVDKLIGKEFERGLAELARVSQAEAQRRGGDARPLAAGTLG